MSRIESAPKMESLDYFYVVVQLPWFLAHFWGRGNLIDRFKPELLAFA